MKSLAISSTLLHFPINLAHRPTTVLTHPNKDPTASTEDDGHFHFVKHILIKAIMSEGHGRPIRVLELHLCPYRRRNRYKSLNMYQATSSRRMKGEGEV